MTPFSPLFTSTVHAARSMFNVLFIFLLLLVATPTIHAEPQGIEQTSGLYIVPAGGKFLRWYAHAERTYFIQVSNTDTPLAKWHWVPVIESGNDQQISYEVDGTLAKGFFRFKYTNQLPGPNETVDTADFDGDGISNIYEITNFATDPLDPDTDGDGLDDDYEIWEYSTDPNNPDTDGDGLSDGDEVFINWTSPYHTDSDNDGLSDGAEVNMHGTNPNLADTDGDGMPDGLEIAHSLAPLNPADGAGDLDLDGMPNGWESINGLDIAVDDSTVDSDGDELNNLAEYQIGTKANRFDSDGDLLPDGWEFSYGLNALSAADIHGMDGDVEPDGVSNINELIHGSSPVLADTDGDGTGDFQEIERGSDPANASDGGQPPPAEDIALVKLTVGDPSGSESERYNMIVKGLEGDTRTITHQAKEFGVVSTESYKLRKGAKYEVEIVHTGTRPEFLEEHGFSNYDWKADIQPDGDALLIKKDPNTILTEVIDWPNSTFQIKAKKAELFVMKFQTLTKAAFPRNRKRKKLGVAEEVDVIVTPVSAGEITWTMSDEKDSGLNTDVNYKPVFTAASLKCDPKVKADFGNGLAHTIDFEVVEPTGESAIKEYDLSLADLGITAQQQGVGMVLRIHLLPDDVSFSKLETKELSGPASNEKGYFLDYTGGNRDHTANANWQTIDPLGRYYDTAAFFEWPKIMVNGNLQWTKGSYEWVIPVRWRVPGKPERTLPDRLQHHEITGIDGASTETKFAPEQASRTTTP